MGLEHRFLAGLAVGFGALAACGDANLDGVRWACATDRECGSGARCRLGICVPSDAPEVATGIVCELAAAEGAVSPRFSLEADAGGRTLVFAAGGREARFALPAEVASLDEGPLEGCCVNPCCSWVPP